MIDLSAVEASARRSAAVGSAMALAGASAYGINIVYARLCAQLGVRGTDIISYRALIVLPLAALLVLAARRTLFVPRGERPLLFRFALSSAATAVCYLTSLQYLPIALAVTIFYTYPLVVLLLTPFVDRVRLPARRWLAALVAFAGVVIAVGPAHASLDARGVIFAGLGSLCCASMFINGSRLTTDGVTTFFWSQMLAAPVALVFALLTGGLAAPEVIAAAFWPFAITALCFFLGFLLQILAAMRISAATSSLLFLMEPICAMAGGMLLLGEMLSPAQMLGIALVIGALAFDLLPALRRSGTDTP